MKWKWNEKKIFIYPCGEIQLSEQQLLQNKGNTRQSIQKATSDIKTLKTIKIWNK